MSDNVNQFSDERHKIEVYILACLIEDPNVRNQYFPKIDNYDFATKQHQDLYDIMYAMFTESENFDTETLIYRFSNQKQKWNFDYKRLIYNIATEYESSDHLLNYYQILKSYSVKQQLKELGHTLSTNQYKDNDIENILWDAQERLLKIMNSDSQHDMVHISAIKKEFDEHLALIRSKSGLLQGTTSGYKKIDKYTGGFMPGEMIVLAARPAMGKTALGINMALHAAEACENDEMVVIFSLEMTRQQLFERMVSIDSEVDSKSIRSGNLNNNDEFMVAQTSDKLNHLPIYIDDSSERTIIDIQASLKQIAAGSKKIKLVVIDYLQLIKGTGSASQSNRQAEVAQISRVLKITAKTIKAPILAIAQLSRAIETRPVDQRTPILSDLKESGSIEQDADIVTFINYDRVERGESEDNSEVKYEENVTSQFIIAKNRSGSTGEVNLHFLKGIGKFIE